MIRLLILIIIPIGMAACASSLFSVHQIDIQQGNALDRDAMRKIRPGMPRKAVIDILGRPVLEPVLNKDRWEYVYYLKKPDVPAQRERLIVHFDQDKVQWAIDRAYQS